MNLESLVIKFLNSLWYITLEMSPYLLLGFLIAGILHVLVSKEMIIKYLGTSSVKSVLYAALIGVPLPLCSCGVIPTGVSLRNNGASKGATVSFLISTPQTGVDSIMISYSLLGLPFALIRPIAAFITGIAGGLLTNTIESKDTTEVPTPNKVEVEKEKGNVLGRLFHYAFIELLSDIAKWLIIGLLLAALIDVLIPANFFTTYIKNDFLSMLLILVVAVPLYVCATSSVPIAAMLMLKGLSPGAALVFLMAGPATNAATITVLSKTMGKKSLFAYLFSIIVGSMLFGHLINMLPKAWFVLPVCADHMQHNHHLVPMWLSLSSTLFLFIMIGVNFYKQYFTHDDHHDSISHSDTTVTIQVDGMTCSKCAMHVENSLRQIDGVSAVKADNISGSVQISATHIDYTLFKQAVEKAGYTFKL